jgi:hypothetical protein
MPARNYRKRRKLEVGTRMSVSDISARQSVIGRRERRDRENAGDFKLCGRSNPSNRQGMTLTICSECIAGSKLWCDRAISRSCLFETVLWSHTPHSSNELTKATEEAGHTNNGVGDADIAGMDVVHRADEEGATSGEKTTAKVIWSIDLMRVRPMLTEGQRWRRPSAGVGGYGHRCGRQE